MSLLRKNCFAAFPPRTTDLGGVDGWVDLGNDEDGRVPWFLERGREEARSLEPTRRRPWSLVSSLSPLYLEGDVPDKQQSGDL